MRARWPQIETWIFDLDKTLLIGDAIYDLLGARMTDYVARATGLPHGEAAALQERYLEEHGATLAGMVRHHGVDPHDFLRDVHDIDFTLIAPDAELEGLLAALPGRKFVYTNGPRFYAQNVLQSLGVAAAFEDVFAIECADFAAKPSPAGFALFLERFAIPPESALFVEDSHRNLATAHDLGLATVLIHPEPAAHWGEHVHHAAEEVKAFLREALESLPPQRFNSGSDPA